jgi:hypothetical protein
MSPQSKFSLRIVFIGILLPLCYALSVGPAEWLCQHGVLSNRFMQRAYAPLERFGGTGQDSHWNWYLGVWQR